jgi:hypothetical protein
MKRSDEVEEALRAGFTAGVDAGYMAAIERLEKLAEDDPESYFNAAQALRAGLEHVRETAQKAAEE